MKFGLWYDFRNPASANRTSARLYAETLEQIRLAEDLGYDDIWLSEHHFLDDGYLPSMLPMAAAIAAVTRRVTIGTNVLLMPFHDPVRLAEDCAVVDILSNGRFIFGPAVGYRLEEFATFKIDRKFRGSITEEAIEVMRKCWTEDEFSFHGRHFHYDNVRCTPKPVQRPIPVWLGATQGEALRRAARIGDGLLGGGSPEYAAALAEYGKDPSKARVAATGRWIYCTDDPKRDWERLRPHALYQLQNYASWFSAAGQPAFGDPPKDYDDLESRGLYLCGTPEQVIEHLTELYAAFPFERHFYWAAWPGMDIETSTRGVRLFAERVIPALRHLGE